MKNLMLISQLGLSMIIPILLCVYLGVKIDERFDTAFTVWFIILGILAGARNVYALVCQTKKTIDSSEDDVDE